MNLSINQPEIYDQMEKALEDGMLRSSLLSTALNSKDFYSAYKNVFNHLSEVLNEIPNIMRNRESNLENGLSYLKVRDSDHIMRPFNPESLDATLKDSYRNKSDFGFIQETEVLVNQTRQLTLDLIQNYSNEGKFSLSKEVNEKQKVATEVVDKIEEVFKGAMVANVLTGGYVHKEMEGYKNIINNTVSMMGVGTVTGLTSSFMKDMTRYFDDTPAVDSAKLVADKMEQSAKLEMWVGNYDALAEIEKVGSIAKAAKESMMKSFSAAVAENVVQQKSNSNGVLIDTTKIGANGSKGLER